MGSIIGARTLPIREFGLTEEYMATQANVSLRDRYGISNDTLVRFAIAPEVRLDVRSVLSGEHGSETGGLTALAAAIEGVVQNPKICAVNISIEANRDLYTDEDRFGIARSLLFVTQSDKAVIIAAGNHGSKSAALGRFITDPETGGHHRVAYVIGAADREGRPSPNNGPEVDLLATGVDVLCAQPIRPRLGNEMLVVYSGSSLATAIVSGCVAAFSSRFDKLTPVEICEAFLATKSEEGMLNLDSALARCERRC
jgi:subtilisin family serine protease